MTTVNRIVGIGKGLKVPAAALALLALTSTQTWAAGAGLPWESGVSSIFNSFKGPVAWAIGGGTLALSLVGYHFQSQLEQVFHSFTGKAIGLAGGLGAVTLMTSLFGGAGALV